MKKKITILTIILLMGSLSSIFASNISKQEITIVGVANTAAHTFCVECVVGQESTITSALAECATRSGCVNTKDGGTLSITVTVCSSTSARAESLANALVDDAMKKWAQL